MDPFFMFFLIFFSYFVLNFFMRFSVILIVAMVSAELRIFKATRMHSKRADFLLRVAEIH